MSPVQVRKFHPKTKDSEKCELLEQKSIILSNNIIKIRLAICLLKIPPLYKKYEEYLNIVFSECRQISRIINFTEKELYDSSNILKGGEKNIYFDEIDSKLNNLELITMARQLKRKVIVEIYGLKPKTIEEIVKKQQHKKNLFSKFSLEDKILMTIEYFSKKPHPSFYKIAKIWGIRSDSAKNIIAQTRDELRHVGFKL